MRRAAIERQRAYRVWRDHIRISHGGDANTGCICDRQVNRFRKGQKRFGCGKPRCYLCHGPKLLNIPTIKDKLADIVFRQSFEDYYGDLQCAGGDD